MRVLEFHLIFMLLRELRLFYKVQLSINLDLFQRFSALGWLLEEIHVTWAHLEKKRTRLRTYTKSHDDFCKQWLETVSQAKSDAEEDGDDEKSEEDSIEYPTSRGDDDADDDGEDLSKDDADDEEEEESSDSEEEEEEHLAPTVLTPALHSSIPAFEDSDKTEPFEEGETAATPPLFGYRVAARISIQPHILMPFRLESEFERLLAIPTPPLSPVSPTSYPLPPFLMPLPIFTPLPTSSFLLPSSLPSTSGSESIPEADIPLRKKARFTTPIGGYEAGESSVVAARQIRPALTIADRRRADDRLIGRLRRERRYFRTLSTTYVQEVAHSRDYFSQIMDYC
nr:hypothetical protein [Tanacetum cinerariifolium]